MNLPKFRGQAPVAGSGVEYRYKCPFCVKKGHKPDDKGHLYFNTQKGVYYCFRCSSKGVIPVVFERKFESLDEVVTQLRLQSIESVPPIMEYPCEVFPIMEGTLPWEYLVTTRGFPASVIRDYNMVYGIHADAYRIFIPVTVQGRMVYWVARSYLATGELADFAPKYMTPKGSSKDLLFNFDIAKLNPQIVITEGVFSAIAAGTNAVATFGKNLTAYQKELLASYTFEEYVVALDPDAKKEARELAIFLLVSTDAKVSRVILPEGEDPATVNFQDYLKTREPVSLATILEEALSKEEG